MSALAAGIAATASTFGGLISAKSQHEANKANQRNFDKSLQFNKEEAAAARHASSVSEQLRQMRQAGLNPAAGNVGATSSGVSSSSPSLPTINAEDAFGRSVMAASLDAAQVANLGANTRKTNEEVDGVKWTNKVLESDAKFADAMHESQIKFQTSSTELNWSNADRLDKLTPLECSQLRAVTKQTLALCDNTKESLKLIGAQVANIEQNTKESEQRVKNMQQDIKESISREILNYAKKHETDANIKYLEELAAHVDVQIGLDGIKCGIAGFDLRLLYEGGYDLNKLNVDYDSKLLPINKLNGIISPYLNAVGSGIGAAARYVK